MYGHSHCFWVPQLEWPSGSHKYYHHRYFVFQDFPQNLWEWGKSINGEMGEEHKESSRTSLLGRHLLPGSKDPASTKSKSWSDEIIQKQINHSMGLPSVDKFSKMTWQLASILRSSSCFLTSNLLSHSVYWEGTLQ